MLEKLKNSFSDNLETGTGALGKGLTAFVLAISLAIAITGYVWDSEPELFNVTANTEAIVKAQKTRKVTGSATVSTLITVTDVLLTKRGGYLKNDIMPPGAWMDNIPNWEFGALVQIRDMVRTLRNNISRSQSQSSEDSGLVSAENQFYFDMDSWMLPETESEYRKGQAALEDYLRRLGDPQQNSAQFYARADNLKVWLDEVDTRLGSLSQRLSASTGKRQLDTSLAGDSAATQSTATQKDRQVKTSWSELDDVFYQARGSTWALILLLRAVEVDFHDVLIKKNALISLQQIIRELEPTQDTLWSPVILNGSGMGVVANHSLVMASHISRANAAIIDLRRLLEQG